ncbi:MAG: NAD(P)H-hydrate dehydratase [Dehalococcoidia bacterium]|nr:NAD(P)H-hydrate dehydratase [Dehalococcoidia bacterium]
MRRLERQAEALGITRDTLMENAGLRVAEKVWTMLGKRPGAEVLALIGPGNNGGDGLVAARHLASWGAKVTAYLILPRSPEDAKLTAARQRGVEVVEAPSDEELRTLRTLLARADLVLDAILGIGRRRPFEGLFAEVLDVTVCAQRERPEVRLVALDLPSGLDADTGAVDTHTPYADLTLTLGFPKVGLFRFPGAERVGRLEVVDIGIPEHLAEDIALDLLDARWARHTLPPRPLSAHKGTFGRVLAVVGSPRYIGAAYLACMGAARVGAGYVTLAAPTSIHPILAAKLTEVTHLPLPEAASGVFSPEAVRELRRSASQFEVLLIGCGLGQTPAAEALLRHLLLSETPLHIPMLLDADALNILARQERWWEKLRAPAVLTPHPGEMARLLDSTVEEVEQDRLGTAREASQRWGVTVVLKGPFTVIASPEGNVRLSPFANPALATAGTGDVLAGAIAGLMAQGLHPFDAASLGVFLHGLAGEVARQEIGDAGTIAGDLLPLLPRVIKGLKAGHHLPFSVMGSEKV